MQYHFYTILANSAWFQFNHEEALDSNLGAFHETAFLKCQGYKLETFRNCSRLKRTKETLHNLMYDTE